MNMQILEISNCVVLNLIKDVPGTKTNTGTDVDFLES
jgi:hypothetical protein